MIESARRSWVSAGVAFSLGAVTFVSLAARADGPPAPPEEAYTACSSLSAGDTCTVTIHDHTIDGKCEQRGSDTRLSCKPNRPPIPPEAFEACAGKKAADACTVSHDGHTMDGTCEDGPGGELHCRPSGPPPR
jgi:hypothetical protein